MKGRMHDIRSFLNDTNVQYILKKNEQYFIKNAML